MRPAELIANRPAGGPAGGCPLPRSEEAGSPGSRLSITTVVSAGLSADRGTMGNGSEPHELPLGLTEEMRTTVLENISDGVYFVDQQRRILFWNRGAERITGFSREEVLGRSCRDGILNHCDDAGTIMCGNACPLLATMQDGAQREAHLYLQHRDGQRKPVRIQASAVRDAAGTIVGAVETFHDNRALFDTRRRAEELERVSMIDPLTGVGNRRFGQSMLASWIDQFERFGRRFGILFADLDRFKAVNDRYGHEAGDDALRAVAATLVDTSRSTDEIIRWGGEEFLVLIADARPATLGLIAERARVLIERTELVTERGRVPLTISMGATLALPDDTPKRIVRRADALLYASKATGRNRITLDPFSRS